MTSKLLLATIATATLLFGAPAYSGEGKDHGDHKEHAKCDPAKDKDCKHGHKKGDDHKHDKK